MDKLNISVTRTIDSGVRPIELKCTPIYDCLFSNVAGLRSRALGNSVDYGTLDPGDYMPALEDDRESAAACTAPTASAVAEADFIASKSCLPARPPIAAPMAR